MWFVIRRDGPGRLGTMARPRGGEWLAEEMRRFRRAGVDVLVSMLVDEEIAEQELADQPSAARDVGIEFVRLPTPDMTAPERAATLTTAWLLHDRLRDGAGGAVHCLGGVGRSSTLAAAVLVLEGLEPAEAWDRISAARGLPVPETQPQRDLIAGLPPITDRA